jgi:hypothetical protein
MQAGQVDSESVTLQSTPNDTVQIRRHMSGFGRQPTFVHIGFVLSERLLCAEQRTMTKSDRLSPLSEAAIKIANIDENRKEAIYKLLYRSFLVFLGLL